MRIWSAFGLAIIAYMILSPDKKSSSPKEGGLSPVAQAQRKNQVITQVFRKPAATSDAKIPDPFKEKIKSLLDLKTCYETHKCPFPDTDPRSYEIALGQKISQELSQLRIVYSRNPKNFKDLQTVAKEFMSTGDGFIQEEVLKILSSLPASEESLNVITDGLQSSADPKLMEQALTEFQRYMGTPLENNVHHFLSTTISTGAQFSSVTVSEKIGTFVNKTSFPVYEKILKKMTPGAKATQNLSAALKEYRKAQTGA